MAFSTAVSDASIALEGPAFDRQGNYAMGLTEQGVFPEINWEVAFQPRHIMGSVAPAYQPSRTPAERNRRTRRFVRIPRLRRAATIQRWTT